MEKNGSMDFLEWNYVVGKAGLLGVSLEISRRLPNGEIQLKMQKIKELKCEFCGMVERECLFFNELRRRIGKFGKCCPDCKHTEAI